MTPRISLVAYADRNPKFIFVEVPNERGRYLRTDTSVIMVECELCKAAVGEPCHNGQKDRKYHVSTHYARRQAAGRRTSHSRIVHPRYRMGKNGQYELVHEGTS